MFKTRSLLLTLLTLAVFPGWGVERETFEVTVTIPTADFYVFPVDPQLVQREQRLPFNTMTDQLRPLRALFDVKNVNGPIDARLSEAAYLSNGRDHIDLRVMFNRVQLNLQAAQVVSAAEARLGARVSLEIVPIKPAGGYPPGEYSGTVHMVFDAIAP